jgi:WD40 repeat protein
LYVLGSDCGFFAIPFPKVRQNFQPEIVPLGALDNYLSFTDESQKSRSFAFLPDPHRFISGSVVDDTFHVFKVESNSISHWASVRQPNALLSSLHCAGGTFILTSLKDSSLSLWNVGEKNPSRIYRQTPHLTSIVDVDTSLTLGIIASLDKNRKCIFSTLHTGQFVKQFEVEKLADGGKDESLSKLLLFAAGYAAVLSDIRTREGATTTLRLYGINTGKLGEFPLEAVSDCCKAEFEGGLSALTLAFENGRFMLIAVPQFKVLMDVTIEKPIASVHFMPQWNGFLVATVDREICLINLD